MSHNTSTYGELRERNDSHHLPMGNDDGSGSLASSGSKESEYAAAGGAQTNTPTPTPRQRENSPLLSMTFPMDVGDEEFDSSAPAEKRIKHEKTKLVLAIVKGFVGSGILFLPRAFANGGYIFSPLMMILVGTLSVICIFRLLKCHALNPYTYGEIAQLAMGRTGKYMVDISLILSQSGFCCAYMIFITHTILHLLGECNSLDIILIIVAQVPLYMVLSLIRDIKSFAWTNLVANALVIGGILTITMYSLTQIGPKSFDRINPVNWGTAPLFIGTAVYSFEGIGLMIPLQDSVSLRTRPRFKKLALFTIIGITVAYNLMGVLPYATFGDNVSTVVTLSLPGDSAWVLLIQVGYCIAVLFTYPLQLFPALRIGERYLEHWGYRFNNAWKRALPRLGWVTFLAIISWAGAEELDNFVSLIGAFCCVPLAFIYPSILHARLMQAGTCSKIWDWTMVVVAFGTLVFCTYESINTWGSKSLCEEG